MRKVVRVFLNTVDKVNGKLRYNILCRAFRILCF